MATCEAPRAHARAHPNASEALHRVRNLAKTDPVFAKAFGASDTPQEAAELAHRYGIEISPAALWRNRGTLAHGGHPTWRG